MTMEILDGRRDVSGSYRVDASRGQRVSRVSSEWFSRPADERFLSLSDLFASVRGRAERSRTRTVESAAIRVEASRDNADRMMLMLPAAEAPVAPTHWSSHGRKKVNILVEASRLLQRVVRITGLSPLSGLMPIDTSPNSHPVAARGSRTTIPHSSGEGSDERDHSLDRLSKPNSSAVRPPASAGTDQAPEDSGKSSTFTRACGRRPPRICASFPPRLPASTCNTG